MKKLIALIATAFVASATEAKDILVNTPATTLLLKAEEGQALHISYYGSRLTNGVSEVYDASSLWEEAYPAFGAECQDITCLSVKHYDGNMSTELVVTGTEERKEQNANVYVIHTKDKCYDFKVDVCYRAFQNSDVIETWSEITNNEKKPVVLQQYLSGFMPVRQGEVWVSHQHGSWGSEAQNTEEPLLPGEFLIHDRSGAKNAVANRPNIMLSLDGKPRENQGRVIGSVLEWSGNFRIAIDTQGKHLHRMVAGIDFEHSEYTLKKGQTFTTPELAFAYSTEGVGGVSRTLHKWARLNNKVYNGQAMRDVLLNSWESIYMQITHESCNKLMDDIKAIGGELFVLDDGWFGSEKYKRTYDDKALGDWATNRDKLPQGIPALQKAAEERGLKFGIWIEPEMTNTASELYETHPDWIVCHPNRKPITGRGGTQLILDMSNPKVQDFVFKVVDDLMTETPKIAYIKWDANFEIRNFGSHYLSGDNQSHLYVDYHLGLRKALERIRQKYPDLVIQCCASGGGRVNYGLMPYFDEFWVSDNTDAQQRLFIQWGTSMYFPMCAMAQHVSASPNHQTGRRIPLKFRFDVAMTGRLGVEMKPSDFNDEERKFAISAIDTYKQLRPLLQHGNLYRIISPYEGNGFCSELISNDDKSEAVFFAYKFEEYVDLAQPRFRMEGIDANATYRLTEVNRTGKPSAWEGKTFSGKFLMDTGLELNLRGLWDSKVVRVVKN